MKRSVLFGALILVASASAAHGQTMMPMYLLAWQRQGEATMAQSCAEMAGSISLQLGKLAADARNAAVASGATSEELATGDACTAQFFADAVDGSTHKSNGNLGFSEGSNSLAAGDWADALVCFEYAIGAYAQAQSLYCSAANFATMAREDYLAVTHLTTPPPVAIPMPGPPRR